MESTPETSPNPTRVSTFWCVALVFLAFASFAGSMICAGVIVESEHPTSLALRIIRNRVGGITMALATLIVITLAVLARTRNELLSWIAVGCFAFFVVSTVVVHLRHLELNPIELPISAYVLYTGERLQVAGMYASGIGCLALGWRLVGSQPSTFLRHAATCLLTIVAVGVFLIATFPIEGYPPPEKLSSLLHGLGALEMTIPMVALPMLLLMLLRRQLGRWFWASFAIAVYLPVHSVIDYASFGTAYAGLAQRIGVLAMLAILTISSIVTICIPRDVSSEKDFS